MKLSGKLTLGFVAVAFLVAVAGIFGLVVSRQIVEHFEGGDAHYRAVVSNATAASRYAKDAQSGLVVYLMLNDPGDLEKYRQGMARLAETVALLDGQVRFPKARRIVEAMKAKLAVFQAQCADLLERYDRESPRGGFLPRNHAVLFREMNRTGSSIRQDGVDLAAVETDFLNKQTAITAATLVSSYAKRAEGHLMVYLTLQNPEERDVFGERHAALMEQVDILQERVEDEEGKAILSDIRASAERLLQAGNGLLASLDRDIRTTRRFNPKDHQDRIREVHRAASELQASGSRLADHSTRLERDGKDRAVRQANSIAYSILLVAAITVLLAVAFGYFFSRRIAHPLKRLGDAAARIGKGELDAKIDPGGSDEIGDLARSIRRMATDLRTTLVSRDHIENVLQSMNDCLAVVALNGRIRTVNRALCETLGYPPEDLPGSPAARLFGEDSGILDSARRELLKAGHFRNVEKTCRAKDGREIDVLLSGSLMRDPAGQPQAMVFVAKDIRDRKRAEEEARHQQARLIHANRMASLGTVVSGVAHEVNNPNNSIMFTTPIVLSAWQDATRILDRHQRETGDIQLAGLPYSEMREAISRMILGISDSSLRIKNIVANLKGFARQEGDPPHGTVDVNEVVRSVVAILNHEIMKGTHRFRTTFGAEHPTVMGSAAELEQVLMNLILNSIQSLPDPGRSVEVLTGVQLRTGTVEIRVRDEGTGIAPDVLERITDPFFTTKHDSGGLGLGLSISKGIVEKHGGEMTFRSVVGRGTEAVIALPLAGGEDKVPASA